MTIATSNAMLIEHRDYGAVYDYGRLRIFKDGSQFHVAYYQPQTYKVFGASVN